MTAYTFDQIIDFTRTSGGGYFGPDGLFRFTPASKNLLTYTQEFDNAAWAKTGAVAYPFDPALATLGPELVVNGGFSTATDWMLLADAPATATIAGGKLTVVSPAGEATRGNQACVKAGTWYRITGEVTVRSGSVKIDVGNVATFTTSQSFSILILSNTTVLSLGHNGACDADFDNISVKEVIGGLIAAPDGTLTADALVANAGTAARSLSQSGGGSGSAQTFSIFVKAGTSNFVQLYHGSSSNIFADFNLATGVVGTVGSSATAAIESAGNGWYRCAITFTPGSASACRAAMITSATAAYAESWTATGAESLYLWGAQVELGSTATSYARNFGGLFPPRFDYDPVTLAPRGLLVEEQRTNLLLRSEEFENAAWTKINATIVANATVAPDGTTSADSVTATGAGGWAARLSFTGAVSTTYTASVFAKAGTGNFVRIYIGGGGVGGADGSCSINLTTGALTSSGAATVATAQQISNGWWRLAVTFTTSNADNIFDILFEVGNDAAMTTTGSAYLWGAQLEAGSFATSYIPTVASQVTRTADSAAITGANFSQFYNQSEGTLLVEGEAVPVGWAAALWGSGTNIIRIGKGQADIFTNGANVFSTSAASANLFKGAIAYSNGSQAAANNGAIMATGSSTSLPSALTELRFESGVGGRLNGHIRSIRYYPTRLSDAQLQALTA